MTVGPSGIGELRRLYRGLSGAGSRLLHAKEQDRAELGALLAPLRELGLVEGPEDNSKFILQHDPDTVTAFWRKMAVAAKKPEPERVAELSALLAYMDTQRLPPPGEGQECETDAQTVRGDRNGISGPRTLIFQMLAGAPRERGKEQGKETKRRRRSQGAEEGAPQGQPGGFQAVALRVPWPGGPLGAGVPDGGGRQHVQLG